MVKLDLNMAHKLAHIFNSRTAQVNKALLDRGASPVGMPMRATAQPWYKVDVPDTITVETDYHPFLVAAWIARWGPGEINTTYRQWLLRRWDDTLSDGSTPLPDATDSVACMIPFGKFVSLEFRAAEAVLQSMGVEAPVHEFDSRDLLPDIPSLPETFAGTGYNAVIRKHGVATGLVEEYYGYEEEETDQ